MKKLLTILLIFVPLSIGQIDCGELPAQFYIRKTEKGTYKASDIWFNLNKDERRKLLEDL